MIPWKTLDRAPIPEGGELTLVQRGDEFAIRVNGAELMASRAHASEERMALIAFERVAHVPKPRVLIGGLGLGYTLRATLDVFPRARRQSSSRSSCPRSSRGCAARSPTSPGTRWPIGAESSRSPTLPRSCARRRACSTRSSSTSTTARRRSRGSPTRTSTRTRGSPSLARRSLQAAC